MTGSNKDSKFPLNNPQRGDIKIGNDVWIGYNYGWSNNW